MRSMACALVLAYFASSAFALDIGDKAPPLVISKWVRGEAVTPDKPDAKTTYVIDFWATWCPPCRKSVPHLNELQERLKGRGVVVVGVSDEDVPTVEKFAGQIKMNYRVAVDDREGTWKTYMEGVSAIPHAFVVNKEGVVVWSGHPMMGLDDVVEAVLAGTYSPEQAKEVSKWKRALEEAQEKRDAEKALKALDEIIKLQPDEYSYVSAKLEILRAKGDAAGVRATRSEAAKRLAKSPEGLNNLAWDIAIDPDLQYRDPALAIKCAQDCVALTQRKESAHLDTLARTVFEVGLLDEAITIQKEALTVARDDREREDVGNALKYYEAAKAAQTTYKK